MANPFSRWFSSSPAASDAAQVPDGFQLDGGNPATTVPSLEEAAATPFERFGGVPDDLVAADAAEAASDDAADKDAPGATRLAEARRAPPTPSGLPPGFELDAVPPLPQAKRARGVPPPAAGGTPPAGLPAGFILDASPAGGAASSQPGTPPADKDSPWAFTQGLTGSLIGTNPKLAGDAAEGFGVLLDAPGLQEAGRSIAGWGDEVLKGYEARVPSFTDIRTDSVGNFISDLGAYAGYGAGSAIGTSVPGAAVGMTTAMLTANPWVGLIGGAAGPSYIQNFGDVYGSMRDNNGIKQRVEKGELAQKDVAQAAALTAIPIAGLDALSLGNVLGTAVWGKAKKTLIRDVAHGMATGAISEGGTEGLQEVISQWAQRELGGDTPLKEAAISVIDNAFAGFFGGGLMGGGASGAAYPGQVGQLQRDVTKGRGLGFPAQEGDRVPDLMRAAQQTLTPGQDKLPAPPAGVQEPPEAEAPVAAADSVIAPPAPPPGSPDGFAAEIPAPPPPRPEEAAILKAQGYSDQDIADMEPEQRAAEVAEILAQTTPDPAPRPKLAPDTPSAEPIKDLLAQAADLQDAANPRQAVWLPRAALDQLRKDRKATKQVYGAGHRIADFDGKGGVLIAKDKAAGERMVAMRDAGLARLPDGVTREDFLQALIGQYTGSGSGKPADGTAVVQQVTPEGAVTRESLVTAAEQPVREAEFAAPDREVRTLMPEEVIARREEAAQDIATDTGAREAERGIAGKVSGAGKYRDGGEWSTDYSVIKRNDGTFVLARTTTSDEGTRVDHLTEDATWAKGEPSKMTLQVGGLARSTGDSPLAFKTEAEALEWASNDLASRGGNDPAATQRKLNWNGLPVSIETDVDNVRQGTSNGKAWTQKFPVPYGDFDGTLGADGDPVDVYVGPHAQSGKVFVVDELGKPDSKDAGKFRQHKVLVGFDSRAAAHDAYANTEGKSAAQVGGITEMTLPELKSWLAEGKRVAPLSDLSGAPADGATDADGLKRRERVTRGPREAYDGPELTAEEINVIVGDWEYVREVRERGRPQSLAAYVIAEGGLQDGAREVRHVAGAAKERPGLVNKEGRSLDDMAHAAWEAGFFAEHTERPTIAEFLDALQEDLHSGMIVRGGDEVMIEDIKIADEIEEELANHGIIISQFRSEQGLRTWLGEKPVATEREQSAREGAAGRDQEGDSQDRGGGAEAAQVAPAITTEKSGQTSLVPEPTTKEKIAAAEKAGGKKGGNEPMDIGMFSAAKDQTDLVDMAKTPAAKDTAKEPAKSSDTQSWLDEREKHIRASRKAGNKHLDDLPRSVEGMRGVEFYNVHDPKERGTVRTVANSGDVVVNWADQYSADKNLIDEQIKDGKAMVWQSWLAPSDLKDYVVASDADVDAAFRPSSMLAKIGDRLVTDGFATIVEARKFVADLGFEGTAKQIDELIEQAVVVAARKIVAAGRSPAKVYDSLVTLYQNQPNLAVRTSESISKQAYSTPMPLAYVASRLAGVAEAAVVLEPTAGNGALLIEASPTGQEVYANELDPARAAALKAQGFTKVKSADASAPGLANAKSADAVIANPPFGAVREDGKSKEFTIDGFATTQIDHAVALNALKAMDDDGKAVLILGGVKADSIEELRKGYRGQAKREFYYKLYNDYNVVDHFTVKGELYQKQGAGWPVDVVVIDGRRTDKDAPLARKLPAAEPPAIIGTWETLAEKLPATAGSKEVKSDDQARGATGSVSPAAGAAAAGEPGSAGRDDGSGRPAERGGVPAGTAGVADAAGGVRGSAARQPADQAGGAAPGSRDGQRGDAGRTDLPGAAADGKPRVAERVTPEAPAKPATRAKTNTTGQVSYRPASGGASLNTLVPANVAEATSAALDRVAERRGSLDGFVADALGYESDAEGMFFLRDGAKERPFSAEQVDAVAAAIDNVERGSAMIIGDQTGIGKGRIAAALLRYAMRNNLVPVLMTEKPDLYGDMYRDLRDIGVPEMLGREPRMFMTNTAKAVPLDEKAVEWNMDNEEVLALNKTLPKAERLKAPKRQGKFLAKLGADDYTATMSGISAWSVGPRQAEQRPVDVVFTTYDQMNTVAGKDTVRRAFMDAIAPQALIVMDEAHNAGGSGQGGWKIKDAPMNRADYARELVQKAAGVVYSSATYAKRPDVMDLYARTDMGKAVDDPKQLPELIEKGGVPMQQVVATMLAESGQYLRRERSFEGINYAVTPVPVSVDAYTQFSHSVRSVHRFDLALKDFRKEFMQDALDEIGAVTTKDGGIGEAAASSTSFAAVMHNIVGQMLLALTADPAADRAIAALKDGKKPVIGLANTMESFLSEFADINDIRIGDRIDVNFGDILQRYLQRTLRITIKLPDGERQHKFIPFDMLPPDLQQMYKAAEFAIENGNYDGMPLSPIDWVRARIIEAGYSVAEVTGRQTMIDYTGKAPVYAQRSKKEMGPSGKRSSIAAFNAGKLDTLIINRSGSTGVSMHAYSKFKDQRPRRMILMQAEGNIDTHMQMLGRVNRTGQVALPDYEHLAPEVPAVARPTAILMKKMASLNANTTGARGSVFLAESVDFMNEYGDRVVAELLLEDPELNDKLGDVLKFRNDTLAVDGTARRATGNLVLLDPVEQAEFLDRVQTAYKAEIERLDALGENALEAKSIDLQARVLDTTVLKERQGDGQFLAPVNMEKISAKAQGRAMAPDEVLAAVGEAIGNKQIAKQQEGEAALTALVSAGRQWQTAKIEEVKRTAQDFIDREVLLASDDAKTSVGTRLGANLERWVDTMLFAAPGRAVTVQSSHGEAQGVVLGIAKTAKGKNPVALSTWEATIAIADGTRMLVVPFSKLFVPAVARGDNENGVSIAPLRASAKEVLEAFDAARREGRETRFIVTGNILSGYDQVGGKGQIINFTNENGEVRPGILMPRDFSIDKFMDSRAVKMQAGAQVLAFLDLVPDAEVTSADKIIKIRRQNGKIVIEMPAARMLGGRYFTEDSVRQAIAPAEFVKSGGVMRVGVDRPAAVRALDAMAKLGAVYETREAQEVAQGVVAANVPKRSGLARTTNEDTRRKSIIAGLRMGKAVTFTSEADAAIEALNAEPQVAPIEVLETVVTRIEPFGTGADVKVIARDRNGDTIEFYDTIEGVAGSSALFSVLPDGTPFTVFFRFETGSVLDQRFRGVRAHEGLHALRSLGYLPGDAVNDGSPWGRLVGHADRLQIMSMSVKELYTRMQHPAASRLTGSVTLFENYNHLYKDLSPEIFREAMEQESVAAMLELYVHGQLSDAEVAPVKDLLDAILSGDLGAETAYQREMAAIAAAQRSFFSSRLIPFRDRYMAWKLQRRPEQAPGTLDWRWRAGERIQSAQGREPITQKLGPEARFDFENIGREFVGGNQNEATAYEQAAADREQRAAARRRRRATMRVVGDGRATPEAFFNEAIEVRDGAALSEAHLYEAYANWAQARGVTPWSLGEVRAGLRDLGLMSGRVAGRLRWIGIAVREDVPGLPTPLRSALSAAATTPETATDADQAQIPPLKNAEGFVLALPFKERWGDPRFNPLDRQRALDRFMEIREMSVAKAPWEALVAARRDLDEIAANLFFYDPALSVQEIQQFSEVGYYYSWMRLKEHTLEAAEYRPPLFASVAEEAYPEDLRWFAVRGYYALDHLNSGRRKGLKTLLADGEEVAAAPPLKPLDTSKIGDTMRSGFYFLAGRKVDEVPEALFNQGGQAVIDWLRQAGVRRAEIEHFGLQERFGNRQRTSREAFQRAIAERMFDFRRRTSWLNPEFSVNDYGVTGQDGDRPVVRAFRGPRIPGRGVYFERLLAFPQRLKGGAVFPPGMFASPHWQEQLSGTWASWRGSVREVPGWGNMMVGEEGQSDMMQGALGRGDAWTGRRPRLSQQDYLQRKRDVARYAKLQERAGLLMTQIISPLRFASYTARMSARDAFAAALNGGDAAWSAYQQQLRSDLAGSDGAGAALKALDTLRELRNSNAAFFAPDAKDKYEKVRVAHDFTPATPIDDSYVHTLVRDLLLLATKRKADSIAIATSETTDRVQLNTHASAAHFYDNQLKPVLEKELRRLTGDPALTLERVELPKAMGAPKQKPYTVWAAKLPGPAKEQVRRLGLPLFARLAPQALGETPAAAQREVDALGFYSPSLEAAKQIPQDKGTVGQMRQMLLTAGGQEKELAAIGFDKAYPDAKAKVTKLELVDWLRANRLRLQKVDPSVAARANEEFYDEAVAEDGEGYIYENWSTAGGISKSYREVVLTLPAARNLDEVAQRMFGKPFDALTERARMHVMDGFADNRFTSGHFRDAGDYLAHYRRKDFPGGIRSIEEVQSDRAQAARKKGLRDPAKIADLQQRIKALQDKWVADSGLPEIDRQAEALAKEAYPDGILPPHPVLQLPTRKAANAWDAMQSLRNGHGGVAPELSERASELWLQRQAINSQYEPTINLLKAELSEMQRTSVAPAPFIDSTSDWVDMVGRQIFYDAAKDPQVTQVAWVPGPVQTERFNLARVVGALAYDPERQLLQYTDPATADRWRNRDSSSVGWSSLNASLGRGRISPEELPEIIGHDLAKQLLDRPLQRATPNPHDTGNYRQHSMLLDKAYTVGGKGMRGFYGQFTDTGYSPGILGRRLLNLARSFDPQARIGTAKIRTSPAYKHQNYIANELTRANLYHVDQRYRIAEQVTEIVANEGADALDSYDAPAGFEEGWKVAVKAAKLLEFDGVFHVDYPAIALTPAMRAQILAGQPLFGAPKAAKGERLAMAVPSGRRNVLELKSEGEVARALAETFGFREVMIARGEQELFAAKQAYVILEMMTMLTGLPPQAIGKLTNARLGISVRQRIFGNLLGAYRFHMLGLASPLLTIQSTTPDTLIHEFGHMLDNAAGGWRMMASQNLITDKPRTKFRWMSPLLRSGFGKLGAIFSDQQGTLFTKMRALDVERSAKAESYFTQPVEMFARAFEYYIKAKAHFSGFRPETLKWESDQRIAGQNLDSFPGYEFDNVAADAAVGAETEALALIDAFDDIFEGVRANVAAGKKPAKLLAQLLAAPQEAPAPVRRDIDAAVVHSQGIIRRVAGRSVQVSYVPFIPSGEVGASPSADSQRATAPDGVGATIGGFYQTETVNAAALMQLATHDPVFDDLVTSSYHEAFHHVKEALANAREKAILASPAEQARMRGYMAAEIGLAADDPRLMQLDPREVEAYAFQRYARERELGMSAGQAGNGLLIATRQLFERFYQMLRRIANALRGHGYGVHEDVFDAAFTGEIAAREDAEGEAYGTDMLAPSPQVTRTPDGIEISVLGQPGFQATWRAENEHGWVTGALDPDAGVLNLRTSALKTGTPTGKGYGSQLYRALIDKALAAGYTVASSRAVSAQARQMYEGLRRKGYAVQLANPDGTKGTQDPVYRVVAGPPPAAASAELLATAVPGSERPTPIEDIGPNDPHPGPVLAYHGTDVDFERFDPQYANDFPAVHFGTRAQANYRSTLPGDENGRVMPVVLDLNNVLDINDHGTWPSDAIAADLETHYPEHFAGLVDKVSDAREAITSGQRYAEYPDEVVVKALNAAGVDGLRYRNRTEGSGWSYMVWEPGKVRSATTGERLMQGIAPQAFADGERFAVALPRGSVQVQPPTPGYPGVLGRRVMRMFAPVNPLSDSVRIKIQDADLPVLRQAVERIEQQIGVKLPVNLDTYVAKSLYVGRAGERLTDLETEWVQPIIEAMKFADIEMQQISEYLYARHAEERNQKIGEMFARQLAEVQRLQALGKSTKKLDLTPTQLGFIDAMTDPDIIGGSGMSANEARAILARVRNSGKQGDFDAVTKIVDAMQEETRKVLLRAGLIDRDTYDNWSTMYANYVPLRGFELGDPDNPDTIRSGRGMDTRGPEALAALGRYSKADNPLAYAVLQAMQAIVRAEKNRVGKTMLRAAEQYPDPNVWEVYRGEYQRRLNASTGFVETYWAPPPGARSEELYGVKVGGKQRWIWIKHKGLARAMRGTSSEYQNAVLRGLMGVMRFYASMLTSWNPEFTFPNMFRDLETALGNISDVKDKPAGIRKQILKEALTFKSVRGIFQALRSGKHATHDYAKWFDEYRLAGGKISFMEFNDVERIKRRIESDLSAGNLRKTLNSWRSVKQLVEDINTAVENAVRLSTYIAMRKHGISQDRAAFVARELTVNFNRKGEWGSAINALYLFFNASVQGTFRVGMAVARSKELRYAVGAIFVAAMMLEWWNLLMADDDDDGSNYYDSIPSWVKERNIVIMYGPGRKDALMIPLAYGYNVPFIAGREFNSLLRGKRSPAEAAMTIAGALLDQVNPLGADPSVSFWQFISPTVIDPGIQALENKTWYGAPIYPKKFDDRMPDSQSAYPSTPWWWKWTAEAINSATGGSVGRSGWADFSPETLEHYATFVSGGVGKFIANALQFGGDFLGGKEWLPEKTPILRRFYHRETTQSKRREFYEAWNGVDQTQYEVDKLQKNGQRDAAKAARARYPAEIEAYPAMKATMRKLRTWREARDKLEKSSLPAAEKQKRIDAIIARENAAIANAIGKYHAAQKRHEASKGQ